MTAPFVSPVPCYDDDAFVATERVPRVVIESSRGVPWSRIHEVSAPSPGRAPTTFDTER